MVANDVVSVAAPVRQAKLPRHMLEHIERLKAWQALDLPAGIERQVHQTACSIAREGGQMTPADRPVRKR
jgi:hypothetical protein